jgi:hypothetical protein
MKKLDLKPEELAVETFETTPEDGREPGTVFAYETTVDERICTCDTLDPTCAGNYTCYVGCGGGGGTATCGCGPNTYDYTCATGSQRHCYCDE